MESLERTGPGLRRWLWINLRIGALSFGSAGRALLYHDALVSELGWLDSDGFQEAMTLAQVLPGPNLANLSAYLGFRLVGLAGAAGGLVMLATPGALFLILAYRWLDLGNLSLAAGFRGISMGSIALFFVLIAKTARGLLQPRRKLAPRAAVALVVLTLAIAGLPFLPVLGSGIALGLICEFSL